jgi:type IV secretion system protein VirB11
MTPEQEKHARLVEQLRRTFGSTVMPLFSDHAVVEIMLNPDGKILVERHGRGIEEVGSLTPHRARNIVNLAAASLETIVNTDRPIVEGALPAEFDRARFEGLVPPLVTEPTFAIRLRPRTVHSLDDYVEREIMTPDQADQIRRAVMDRQNILVAGGTGSGKTTLLNAILAEIAGITGLDQRIVMIEDTSELKCDARNVVPLLTSSAAKIDMTVLLKATLRLRPDRIIVGEVRDGAALALLKAWNTGHPGGAATLHANNPRAALLRLDQLCQEAGVPPQQDLIREAVDIVIQIARDATARSGRRITDLLRVKCD